MTFAGWKDNGGGYQVWIAHGSNLFTTYNHMSSVSVGRGQHVDRGQHVGRMGATGFATGSHLHFEVWRARSGTAANASTRSPTCRSHRTTPVGGRLGRGLSPCENGPDVPRSREDLGPRRRWW